MSFLFPAFFVRFPGWIDTLGVSKNGISEDFLLRGDKKNVPSVIGCATSCIEEIFRTFDLKPNTTKKYFF